MSNEVTPPPTGTGELVKVPAKSSNGLLLAIATLATVTISVVAVLLLTKKRSEKAEPEKERKIEYKKVIAVEPGETKEIEIDENGNPILPDGAEKLEDQLINSEKDDEKSISEEAEPTSPRDLEVLPASSMLSSIATMTSASQLHATGGLSTNNSRMTSSESPRSISSKSTINESVRSRTGPMKNFSTTTIGSNRSLTSKSGVRKSRLNRRKGNSKNDEIDQTYCSSELSNAPRGRKGASLKGKKSAEQLRKNSTISRSKTARGANLSRKSSQSGFSTASGSTRENGRGYQNRSKNGKLKEASNARSDQAATANLSRTQFYATSAYPSNVASMFSRFTFRKKPKPPMYTSLGLGPVHFIFQNKKRKKGEKPESLTRLVSGYKWKMKQTKPLDHLRGPN